MSKLKDYIQLHLNILLFSLTSVFSKAASVQYNKHGLSSPLLYLFLFLMVANCGIYAITWQRCTILPGTTGNYGREVAVHRLCQQKCLSSVVADMGSADLS